MYITLWGYLVSHCMPNLLWERDKTRYICIYIQITDWVSCMAYPFSLLRLLFCIEVGLIVIYTLNTQNTDGTFHFFSFKFYLKLKIFTKFHDFCSLLQKGPKMFLSSTFYINIQLIIEHGRLQKNKISNKYILVEIS